MPTPSLLIVPARFKTGKLYSQIPTSGAGDFTVTRNTEARRVNSAGLIESVASGIPRLDYLTSGGTAGCPALLVEPAATNLALQSEAWNVSPWAATSGGQGATVSGNVTASPDGTTNADKLIEAAVTGTHFCQQNLTLTSGTTYTASLFVKASERTLGRFRMSGSGAYWDIDFNLTAGTATGPSSVFIQNYGNGWYRIGGTFTANQASNNFIVSLRDASGNTSYTGNGTNGFFVYGAQLETGSVATSYIPTTAGTGSRSADVISVSGAVSGSIGQTAGTIYCEFEHTSNTAERRLIALSDGGATNRIFVWGLNNILYAEIRGNSVIIANPIPSGYNKVAFAYQQNGVSGNLFASINGGAVVSGTSTTYPATINRVAIGSSENAAAGVFQWNNRIRAAALYTTRLTNAELQSLTQL